MAFALVFIKENSGGFHPGKIQQNITITTVPLFKGETAL
jgi:hypothetical protein